jgi:para-nitrobenzyl esterase
MTEKPIAVDGGPLAPAERDLKGVHSFKGIPYAAPPAGRLRWHAPASVTPWEGNRPSDPGCWRP